MAFTPSSKNDSRASTAALVAENTNTSNLSTDSANVRVGKTYSGTASPTTPVQQGSIDGLLRQSQENQVAMAMNLGKINPVAVISLTAGGSVANGTSCSIATSKLANQVLVGQFNALNTLLFTTFSATNPCPLDNSGQLTAQFYSFAEQIVLDSMAQGLCSAATILNSMGGGN